MNAPEYAITTEGLRKRFGTTQALDGVDLAVKPGMVLGVLGPNGAGKTTTIRILATLLRADAGHATVAGFDVASKPAEVRRSIGLTGQYASVDEDLTGTQNPVTVNGRGSRPTSVHCSISCPADWPGRVSDPRPIDEFRLASLSPAVPVLSAGRPPVCRRSSTR